MRILFPCDINPYYDSSATGNRNESLINGLTENGVNVHIIVIGGYNSWQEYLEYGSKCINSKIKFTYPIFTFQNNVWARRFNRFVVSKLLNSFIYRKLEQEYKNNYDYVWITGSLIVRKSVWRNLDIISKKSKTIIELSEFQNISKIDTQKKIIFNLNNENEYSKVTLKLIRHVDYFVIMTKTLMRYYKNLAQNPNAKFIHLPMTVDFERFSNITISNKWTKPYIAFTGTYTNLKDGIDILIHAFSKIHPTFPDYKLLLAGFYHPDVNKQKQIIRNLGLEDNIKYIGVLDKSIIPMFLANAHLLVLPRPNSKQAEGGFPTKLGEYLASGNPLCCTKVGEIPDYLIDGESVFFAEPGSVDSFANAMFRALVNLEKAKKIAYNGLQVAKKNFNKDIQGKLFYNFLKQGQNENKK